MKFLLEFVTWCGSASRRSARPRAENVRSVVLRQHPRPESGRNHRRKRGRAAALRSKSVSEWRPSLYSISEDNAAPERDQQHGSERILKRKVTSTTATATESAGVHIRSYSDDFGRSGLPAIIPAFSPTPFFF